MTSYRTLLNHNITASVGFGPIHGTSSRVYTSLHKTQLELPLRPGCWTSGTGRTSPTFPMTSAQPLNSRQSKMKLDLFQCDIVYDHLSLGLVRSKGPPACPGQVPPPRTVFSEQWRKPLPCCLFQQRINQSMLHQDLPPRRFRFFRVSSPR